MTSINRRHFLASATAATVAAASRRTARAAGPNDKVVLAIMGANNRGSQLATGFAKQPNAAIAYICDCDEHALQKGIEAAQSNGGPAPKGIKDFRKALDDPAVDALVCAAPNHWHAPATILALAAGKNVYVEKPACHAPEEGERMIAAAQKANRVVQVGMQRRSNPHYLKAIERVRDGALGKVLYAKSTYYQNRPSIGHGKETSPPAWLDYNLWQGPLPERPFRDNLIHYNWHFFWHWGNSEIGNNGIHTIDVCRWALDVKFPSRVTCTGSKLRYDDDQETPDTCTAVFECDGRTMVWEGISWSTPYQVASGIGIELRGEDATMYLDDSGYKIYDLKRKVVEEVPGMRGDADHLNNFLEAVRNGATPNANIEDGHRSALLCHLGNIAYRTGQTLEIDPATGHIKNNTAADALWTIEYRKGWLPEA